MNKREKLIDELQMVLDEKTSNEKATAILRLFNVLGCQYRVEWDEDDERWYLCRLDEGDNYYEPYPNGTGYDEDRTDCRERSDCIRIARDIANESKPCVLEIMTKANKMQWTERYL